MLANRFIMSIKKSIAKQTKIEDLKTALSNAFSSNLITDVILLEFPKWSIYYVDNDSNHSFNYDCFTNAAIYKFLKARL